MKISKYQLMQLYQIAVASLAICNSMAFTQEARQKLVDDILNQQDSRLVEITDESNPKSKCQKN